MYKWLSSVEHKKITVLCNEALIYRKIVSKIGWSIDVTCNFLEDTANCGKKKSPGQPFALNAHMKSHFVNCFKFCIACLRDS